MKLGKTATQLALKLAFSAAAIAILATPKTARAQALSPVPSNVDPITVQRNAPAAFDLSSLGVFPNLTVPDNATSAPIPLRPVEEISLPSGSNSAVTDTSAAPVNTEANVSVDNDSVQAPTVDATGAVHAPPMHEAASETGVVSKHSEKRKGPGFFKKTFGGIGRLFGGSDKNKHPAAPAVVATAATPSSPVDTGKPDVSDNKPAPLAADATAQSFSSKTPANQSSVNHDWVPNFRGTLNLNQSSPADKRWVAENFSTSLGGYLSLGESDELKVPNYRETLNLKQSSPDDWHWANKNFSSFGNYLPKEKPSFTARFRGWTSGLANRFGQTPTTLFGTGDALGAERFTSSLIPHSSSQDTRAAADDHSPKPETLTTSDPGLTQLRKKLSWDVTFSPNISQKTDAGTRAIFFSREPWIRANLSIPLKDGNWSLDLAGGLRGTTGEHDPQDDINRLFTNSVLAGLASADPDSPPPSTITIPSSQVVQAVKLAPTRQEPNPWATIAITNNHVGSSGQSPFSVVAGFLDPIKDYPAVGPIITTRVLGNGLYSGQSLGVLGDEVGNTAVILKGFGLGVNSRKDLPYVSFTLRAAYMKEVGRGAIGNSNQGSAGIEFGRTPSGATPWGLLTICGTFENRAGDRAGDIRDDGAPPSRGHGACMQYDKSFGPFDIRLMADHRIIQHPLGYNPEDPLSGGRLRSRTEVVLFKYHKGPFSAYAAVGSERNNSVGGVPVTPLFTFEGGHRFGEEFGISAAKRNWFIAAAAGWAQRVGPPPSPTILNLSFTEDGTPFLTGAGIQNFGYPALGRKVFSITVGKTWGHPKP